MIDLKEHPHRRLNPLTGEWVLVSPHRTKRPWQGQMEKVPPETRAAYDPKCYLCPGNERAGGHRNPAYSGTFAFDNDFAALIPGTPAGQVAPHALLQAEGVSGLCRVICFSPRHDLTMAEMAVEEIRRVVDTWTEQYVELNGTPGIAYVEIFENRGEMMGCSNPHPHCQIWSSSTIPNEIAKEDAAQNSYFRENGRTLLSDYLEFELSAGERLVSVNEHFVALVPWWAVWPFETMVISRRAASGLDELTSDERNGLADILKQLTTRYDNLFEVSFPYSGGFHQRPATSSREAWHLHAHYYPPLLRSATVRKFLVGYEMLAMPQRDITPEAAALRLRELSDIHFKLKI
ncbi:UDP-glucose--hexose-1-phosphate uridylyltransferase [Paludibaculum fermentans]|uniref:Galactose-1-phosphate uridylyltransferase n=1 Tax=Paludibaculum fermentans TaxID=1473598 RepID=A0A7S7NQ19_PALFE|nr:UDP-glucose--hexose-1-phosphate uridylyltransferase [Paludibaculum fermentans]QOY87604.1 UDP-glucose--hexose-1-phosphate uridylyltransferase [Paludibaculum fermentans]